MRRKPWIKESSIPPLPIEWLVSLYDYHFYQKGQEIELPSMDPVIVSFNDGGDKGIVMMDTLFDKEGREVLPDIVVDQLAKRLNIF